MHSLGMVSFTTTPEVVNGCFGTMKADGSQRFVFDGRPTNGGRWVPSPTVRLPTPDLLSRLEVPAGEKVYVCKSDLDNYYHRLLVPVWMRPYFALPAVRAGDVPLPSHRRTWPRRRTNTSSTRTPRSGRATGSRTTGTSAWTAPDIWSTSTTST
jgi:hypothetical protein